MLSLFRRPEPMPATPEIQARALFTDVPDEDAWERLLHLRVKVKTLAAEAAIIRWEARRTCGLVRRRLNQHRTTVVRAAARTNLLAYGLLRGVPYARMERTCRLQPDLKKVESVARRFDAPEAAVRAWVEAAQAHLKACAGAK